MNSSQRFTSRIVLLGIIAGALLLAISLYWTQIIKGQSYADKANQQYVKPSTDQFDRGTIYFQSKDGVKAAAAAITSGYLIYMNPGLIGDAGQAYDALSQYLKIDKGDFIRKAGKANDHYEVVLDEVDDVSAKSVQGLKLAGIGVAPKTWRTYPGGDMASHVLGIVGEDTKSAEITGKYGLERYYQEVLSRAGVAGSINVFAELFSGLKDSVFGGGEQSGDLVTTIDPTAQQYLEKILGQTSDTWHPDEIGGIIMDPNTGAIIAMASLPTFDPNDTSKVKDISVLSDPLVEHVYEMGSIVKPLTMATALDSGAEQADSTYDDTGTMTLSGKKISNFDGRARGVIPMQQILSQSLNVGAATIALKVGKDDFAKYFTSFGLGDKTGIDQPNESLGLVNNLKTGRDVEVATAAYGQGIAVSPINIARALSVLANGGYLVTPHIVNEIDYTDGSTKKIAPPRTGPVLKKQTTDEVTGMLVKVVDEAISKAHPDIHFDNYSIAAKTGTAQIANPATKSYYSDRYLHSFFGYFPAYNPKFIVFLYQVYPKGAEYASATLTDPFSELAKFLISYYNVAPDR